MAFITSTCISLTQFHFNSISSRNTSLIKSSFHGFQIPSIRSSRLMNHSIYPKWKMLISSNDFRPGTTIEFDGGVYRVIEFLHVKPGKGAAFVRTKLKNMKTGGNLEKTFKAGEMVAGANLEKAIMQHTYIDGDDYVFMNLETFEEERLSEQTLGENVIKFLTIGLDVEVLKYGDDILGIDLPKTLSFTVTQTDPGVRGNTVQGGTKPAIIETGAEIMVPLFISVGEKINVNTEDGKYLGRDNK